MADFHRAPDMAHPSAVTAAKRPLVSVVVITYNSADYVLETLESIKSQTYDRLELVISDDASSDRTVDICRDWLALNSGSFVKTTLVEAASNGGVPANCNRGVRASSGEWVKLIAGDDILVNSCVENNLCFAISNGAEFVVSAQEEFDETGRTWEWRIPSKFSDLPTSKQQWLWLMTGYGYLPGSAVFFHRGLFQWLGGFDERYYLVEDRPFMLGLTRSGSFIWSLNEVTVRHRRHSASITARSPHSVYPKYMYQVYQCIALHGITSFRWLEFINAIWNLVWYQPIRLTGSSHLNGLRISGQPIRVRGMIRRFGAFKWL